MVATVIRQIQTVSPLSSHYVTPHLPSQQGGGGKGKKKKKGLAEMIGKKKKGGGGGGKSQQQANGFVLNLFFDFFPLFSHVRFFVLSE